ncbi:cob(I)yrinic acid a,c-diamide adenosyltransferase [Geothermobacter ehrlichii]|uniref:corrinoid adenosyltransferase n=1 Tax=Geothermobacter ehrlichii TaxID=213224 RepID=A0A5D3WI15_9BACT|nr:cob(I)yrinic acid a,c-diamide adenosyltransferase [Geothermobacter ehrlichii]TYO98462.1 cob(I)yrinic acid a,c-diamide adenosyltransferase [Geothermobacter ehrlichii]
MDGRPTGLLQVYTGDGKGKTSAAIGLLARFLGHGRRCLLVRFLKPEQPESGELRFFRDCSGLEILNAGLGVVGRRVDPERMRANVTTVFRQAAERLATGRFDLAVFDEINNCLARGYLTEEELLAFLQQRPAHLEVVCTGRNAPPFLLARADLVTSMEKIRHPFDRGIAARAGIEY